jgi:hypothetical protein
MNNRNCELLENHIRNAGGYQPKGNREEVPLEESEKRDGHNLHKQAILFLSFGHLRPLLRKLTELSAREKATKGKSAGSFLFPFFVFVYCV